MTRRKKPTRTKATQSRCFDQLDQPKGRRGERRQAMFQTKCSACHAIGPFDQKIVGPGLKGVLHDPAHPNLVTGEKARLKTLRKILQNGAVGPMGRMPNQTANALTDKDIANLVAYLNSLK